MPRITYDAEMRKTEHGGRLYSYWRKLHNKTEDPTFQHYPDFFEWAMKNGYTVGAKLFRHDEEKPFSAENCFWVPREKWVGGDPNLIRNRTWEQKWDEAVNRIRRHYGMKEIHSSEV